MIAEVETIVNSRPIVVETNKNVSSKVTISPSHVLTMKSKVVMPPPGVFGKPDLYCQRRQVGSSISVMNFGVSGEKNFW